MPATDYIANNVWRLQEQAKRLRDMASALLREAQTVERTADYIQQANRKRLNQIGPSITEQAEWDRMTSAEQEAFLATEASAAGAGRRD
jgi:hypothetical protein